MRGKSPLIQAMVLLTRLHVAYVLTQFVNLQTFTNPSHLPPSPPSSHSCRVGRAGGGARPRRRGQGWRPGVQLRTRNPRTHEFVGRVSRGCKGNEIAGAFSRDGLNRACFRRARLGGGIARHSPRGDNNVQYSGVGLQKIPQWALRFYLGVASVYPLQYSAGKGQDPSRFSRCGRDRAKNSRDY
jgi:hypothetical protein